MDPRLREPRPDAVDGREGPQSGQRSRRGASAGKQEFFHKRSFQGVSIDEFVTLLDECMVWYRDKRIKLEYGMSIMDKRIELGLVA